MGKDKRKRNSFNGTLKSGSGLFDEVILEYGADSQKFLCFEKMAELISAIGKYERKSNYSNAFIRKDVIASKIADVEVMLAELRKIYKISDVDVNAYVDARLASIDVDLQRRLYNRAFSSSEFKFSLQ